MRFLHGTGREDTALPLLSPEAAFVTLSMLEDGDPDRQVRSQRGATLPLRLKTGTSNGFRDAWAIGVGPRHLIGIWIGRPDGTPVPGQFGLASAAPLLLQVHDLLVNRVSQRGIAAPADRQPAEVGVDPAATTGEKAAVRWTKLELPPARQAVKLIPADDPAKAADELVRLLRDEAKVL